MSLNHDIGELGGRNQPIEWEPDPLERIYERLKTTLQRNIPKLAAMAEHGEGIEYSTAELIRLYGDVRSPWHCFSCKPVEWGFNFTEPQVTKALEYFLSPKIHGETGSRRCEAFVRALYLVAGRTQPEDIPLEFSDAEQGILTVEAECSNLVSERGRRTDLIIKWTVKGAVTCMFVLEFKFGHHVTEGQLQAYEEHCRKVGVESDNYELFLVAKRLTGRTAAELAKEENARWIPLTWRSLIRRFEFELSVDESLPSSSDFARLRRTIWEMS